MWAARGLFPLALLVLTGCGDSKKSEKHVEATAAPEQGDTTEGVVHLDSVALASSSIRVGRAESINSTGLAVTGSINYDPNLVSHIGSRTEGRILELRADIGQRVSAGQPLALLESPEVGQVRSEERQAETLLKIAQENYGREQRLEEQGIASRKELLDSRADLTRAESALQSAQERLRVLGAGHGEGGQFAITAPFAGAVVQRDANRGEMASPSDQLFTVADLSRVWVELNIFERDLARVVVGQSVAVGVSAYSGERFPGRIVYVGAILDTATRTVRARVEVPNRDGRLRPGMFATAAIQIAGKGLSQVAVIRDALQEVEGKQVVFVPGTKPGEFRSQAVEPGDMVDGNRVIILAGLKSGDSVVVSGAFLLRSELAKSEIGEHGH
jgi:cobalt-zinc-cadmium efflux system membrane fusion protein